jgi:ABC-type glutathione transport system ATPase component
MIAERSGAAMLELIKVSKEFRTGFLGRNINQAVIDASLCVDRGEIVGLIGESGCGKSTLGRIAVKLLMPSRGRIILDGVDVTDMPENRFRKFRRQMQIIFQHPETALDPQFTLMESILESFNKIGIPKEDQRELLEKISEEVNLPLDIVDRHPNQVSGGEIQRAVLTRVFAFKPRYLILDEPTSMLDVSVQAHILQLLKRKAKQDNMGMLFISHDLEVIRAMCDRVAVMKEGMILEEGMVKEIFNSPKSCYMSQLIEK